MFAKNIVMSFLLVVALWFQPAAAETSSGITIKASDIFSLAKKLLSELEGIEADTAEAGQNYSRAEFGHGWSDDDGDCQNTRHEALIAQSQQAVTFKTNRSCQVLAGTWDSPYSNKLIYQSSKLDIDHVVPLKWAWEHGAAAWPKAKRVRFANDPINLLAVEARLNRQKGAKGPLKWLPPQNKCPYIDLFATIINSYQLTYSPREAIMAEELQLKHCA
mgnify:FL=1